MIPWNLIGYASIAATIFFIYCATVYILDIHRDKKTREKILGLMTEYLTERETVEFMINYVGLDWRIRPGIYWKKKMQGFLGYDDPKEPIEGVIVKILQIMKAILSAEKPERMAMERKYESIKTEEEKFGNEEG